MDDINISAWLDLLSQNSRFVTLEVNDVDGLLVERFTGREGINEPFRFDIDCISASAYLDTNIGIGKAMTLAVITADGSRRYWHGHVSGMAALGADGGMARYRLIMESALSFLKQRRNTLIFQDKTALDVVGQVFADHPELHWRDDTTVDLRQRPICTQYRETDFAFMQRLLGEEGLSYRFEHGTNDDDELIHTLVVFNAEADHTLPAGAPEAVRFHRVNATEQTDGITLFSERRQLVPDRLTTASWKADQVKSISGEARVQASDGAPELPDFDIFEAGRAGRFDNTQQADNWATHQLDALRQCRHSYSGQSGVRTLAAGYRHTLVTHPKLSGQAFVPLWVEHHATNNLGTELARLCEQTDTDALGKGSYRNRFLAVPAGTALAPSHRDKPLAPGDEVAIVTGITDAALTGTRDHQVRIQFWWQRGSAPLAGGLSNANSRTNPQGHAPLNEHSGTWVRVAESAAGAHHGHSFVPRIGSEVLVEYAHGDVDRPVVIGQLYNGATSPPFAAGGHSGSNHPGTLSGLQTRTLDGTPSGQWVLDDASGQLRQSLRHDIANSQLHVGYLISQNGSYRGGYRGDGFELSTQGWAVIRAGQGMLLSATARRQGHSTQMDTSEARSQLKAAAATAERLDNAATTADAQPLSANSVHTELQRIIDPARDGKYVGPVNGMPSTRPTGRQRSGGDPVEHFKQPAMVIESPENIALTTSQSNALLAGRHQHFTSQRDTHWAAGATVAAASGQATGLYTADGGINIIANHGPVSIEAHTDAMQIAADQSVTVTSTTNRIDALAHDSITLQAGSSEISLDGANINITCPGSFTVKAGSHNWAGGKRRYC